MKVTARIFIIILFLVCHFGTTEIGIWTNTIFYLSIALLSVLAVIVFWKSDKQLKINIPETLLIGFVVYLVVNNVIIGSFVGNERLHNYLILLLLYFAFKLLHKNDNAILTFVFYGLLAGLIIELLTGFGQLFGIVPNSDSKFLLGGLLGNPGAFAGYMAIVFPFLFTVGIFYMQFCKSENFLYTIVLCIICAASLIILCDSRGAWLASFIGVAFVLNQKYKFASHITSLLKTTSLKLVTAIVLLLVGVFISFALYHYKQESAFGRLFVWKISKQLVFENPTFGSGFGSFEAGYGKAQAHYFLNNNASASEMQVADYVTCAYNEFLEIIIESGIIGLLLFGAILYFAYTKRNDENNPRYFIAARAMLVAFLVLSLVSYPFRLIPNLLLFVICLFIIFSTGHYKIFTLSKYSKLIAFIWLFTIWGLVYCGSKNVYGMYHFRKGYKKVLNYDFDNGINDYKKAYRFLSNNGEFLFYYGSALYLKQDYNRSIDYLKKATILRSDPNAFLTLGRSLQQIKRYPEAELAYQMTTGITPTRLYPKYLLAKLYIEMQQPSKALKMAETIISTKEKVSTTAGSEIKTEMKLLISQYSISNVKP